MNSVSSPWMGTFIDFRQSRRDRPGCKSALWTGLRGQQFLNGPQVTAMSQQVGGKRMTKGVWGCTVGQAERSAGPCHCKLDEAGP